MSIDLDLIFATGEVIEEGSMMHLVNVINNMISLIKILATCVFTDKPELLNRANSYGILKT